MKEENPSAALLTFLDLASNNIKSALQKPSRPKRRSNNYHRKYLSRNAAVTLKPPDRLTIRPNAARQRQMKSSTIDQRMLEQKTMEALFEVSLSEVPPIQNKPPLRMRKLPASFFLEPSDSITSGGEDSSTSIESTMDPLKDLLGPDSPMEELLSSPTWKAIVASNSDFFSYPATPERQDEMDEYASDVASSCPSTSVVTARCKVQEESRQNQLRIQEEEDWNENRVRYILPERNQAPEVLTSGSSAFQRKDQDRSYEISTFRSCCRFENDELRNGQPTSESNLPNEGSADGFQAPEVILQDLSVSFSCAEIVANPEMLERAGWRNYDGGWSTEASLSRGRCSDGRMNPCMRNGYGLLLNKPNNLLEGYCTQNLGVVFGERGIWCQ